MVRNTECNVVSWQRFGDPLVLDTWLRTVIALPELRM